MSKPSIPKLCFLCFGVGAIGTYIGGSLALIGQKVVFVERPAVADEVKRKGLSLRIKNQEKRIADPDVVSSIEEALRHGPFDVAILAVKSFDTEGLLQTLVPYAVALPPFLCLQNGVENESKLAQVFGSGKVIAGSITTAVGRRGAGDIILERLRGIGIASDHILTPTLIAVLQAAGLKTRHYHSASGMKWSKMLTNLLANASSAILDLEPKAIFSDRRLYWLEVQQFREALAVMDALKIRVTDLPGTPVKMLSWLMETFPPAFSQPILVRALGKGRGGKMPSFHIDLSSGRGFSEVDYLNGAVTRFGKETGIPTPVNDCLNQTLIGMTNGTITRSMFAHNPEKLLTLVDEYIK
jgi:2-dehydropantoate 2-reductase